MLASAFVIVFELLVYMLAYAQIIFSFLQYFQFFKYIMPQNELISFIYSISFNFLTSPIDKLQVHVIAP